MAVFPLAKLGTLVIKQVSKPLASIAKNRAKNSHFFRTYVLMPPAQFYHWCEVRMKMYVMNLGRTGQSSTIPRLSEEAAIELGANLLGEGVIFGIAVAILAYEVSRQKEKEKKKEEAEQAFINNLETRINELTFSSEELDTKVRELTRLSYALQSQLKTKEAKTSPSSNRKSAEVLRSNSQIGSSSGAIIAALIDARSRIIEEIPRSTFPG
ncbi:hypothetical protein OTU49_001259 [Cherax quadricarinatus]|uniref:OPA3-like protein n=1 Tax=Cherax quadricarinatus TaxID=27406 RepID=A0AAW0XVU1_CHEQU|nr:putative OPA3-like protein CG13603 isoform X2 [Cherax quadricarinatus]